MNKRFNPGDRVRCLIDAGGCDENGKQTKRFTKGKIYIVREYPTKTRDSVGTFFDDDGAMDNGLPPEYWEVVTSEEKTADEKKV